MTLQVAVKLPDAVVRKVDALVAEGAFDSRSHAVRHALNVLLAAHDRQRIDEGFAEGFARQPDRDDELADATRLAIEAINDEPWEPWW